MAEYCIIITTTIRITMMKTDILILNTVNERRGPNLGHSMAEDLEFERTPDTSHVFIKETRMRIMGVFVGYISSGGAGYLSDLLSHEYHEMRHSTFPVTVRHSNCTSCSHCHASYPLALREFQFTCSFRFMMDSDASW